MTFQEKVMYGEWTYERLKDEVHSKSLELEEKEKQYNELSNTAIKLDSLVKEKQKEIERLNNIIKLKTDFIAELLKIILVARDYELHEKCEVRSKLYEDKLQELKGE